MSGTTTARPEQLPAVIQPTPTPQPTPTRFDDLDETDLATAQAEVAAEDAGTPAPRPAAPQPATRPAGAKSPAAPEILVPKFRFDAVARERKALADENLYLKGALAVARQGAPAGAPAVPAAPATPQPTIEAQIAAQANRILAASKQFDAGELSMEQFKVLELQASDIIANLRANHLLAHVQGQIPQATGVGLADSERLDQHVEEMAATHPWSTVLNDNELTFLANLAKAEAQGLQRPIGTGPVETLRLRQAVAELADVYGPRWYGPEHPNTQEVARLIQERQPPQQPSPGATPPAQSRAAAGRSKVELAARQPPNTSTAGHADVGADVITEDRIDQMTEDEIAALPQSVRDRLLAG